MLKMKCQLFLVLVLAASALAACGDDEPDANGTTDNIRTNNADNSTTPANNTSANNTSANNTTANNTTVNNTTPNNTTAGCQPLDPAIGPCDPLCQLNCEMGDACVAASPGPGAPTASQCVMAGTAMEGDVCGQNAPCAAGFSCIVENMGDTMGTCAAFCRIGGGEPSCGDGTCAPTAQDVPDLGVCRPPCTPFPNDSCEGTQQCYPANQTGGTLCAQPGAIALGGACTNLNECVADAICSNGTCVAQCDPTAANPCGDGATCTTLTGDFAGCVATCDVFPNDNCPDGQMCYPTNAGSTACAPFNATANVGDACQFLNECNDEQACVNAACAPLCPTAGMNDACQAGEQCVNIPGTPLNACISM